MVEVGRGAREVYDLVREQFGPGWARAGLLAIPVSLISGALFAFVTLVKVTLNEVVRPLGRTLVFIVREAGQSTTTPPNATNPYVAILVVAVVVVFYVSIGFWLGRRIGRWQVRLYASLDERYSRDISKLGARVEALEGSLTEK